MGMFDKENIADYREPQKIFEDSEPFKAADGSYHATMKEVEAYNNAYWQCKNPFIIDKDSELFNEPLPQDVYDSILDAPNYRTLIDILEGLIISHQLEDENSKGIKR